MSGRLEGRVAVVTGAGSGMGRATTALFAREGARVVAADISDDVRATAAECGESVTPAQCDVSHPAEVKAVIDLAVARHGRLDILCNVAGIVRSNGVPIDEVEIDDWDRVLDVNLKGTFLGMKYAIPHMIAGGGGAIVNWASVGGLVATGRAPAYSSSKAAVIHLSRTAAVQYGKQHVRVNCICPGFILTNIFENSVLARTPERREQALRAMRAKSVFDREGTPDEVAEVALFLSTDASSFITGAALPVDGGWSVRSV